MDYDGFDLFLDCSSGGRVLQLRAKTKADRDEWIGIHIFYALNCIIQQNKTRFSFVING